MNSLHPCFNASMHHRYGRVHLPVAPRCNIQCGFCDRRYSCVNESRPGVTASVISPIEAEELARLAVSKGPISVLGIAGPGDPLANPEETLATLERVHHALPDMLLCLSTNGLVLPTYAERIAKLGVSHLTVTVNAIDPKIGAKIYSEVRDNGFTYHGEEAASLLLERQRDGILQIKKYGVVVKVNTVVIPSINSHHVEDIARNVASWGADVMNCMALLPVEGTPLAQFHDPSGQVARDARQIAGQFLPQMRHCARCRADACGLLGEGTTLEDCKNL